VISATFAVADNVTHVVQRGGKATTFTCKLPPSWSECRFEHHDGSQEQCSVFNRDGGTVQPCGEYGESTLSVADGVCRLEHTSVTADHNGTWSCAFTDAKPKRGQLGQIVSSSTLGDDHARDFTLSILHEPSNIEAHPENDTTCNYNYLDLFQISLTMYNVAPKPKVQWTFDNQIIFGSVETNVSYEAQYWEVTERLQFIATEEFDGKDLQYRVIIEVVDEFGNSTEEFVSEGKIRLNCQGCPESSSTSTKTSSTLTTVPIESTTAEQTTPTATTPTATTPTTTTPTATTPTAITPTATTQTPINCNFNLTDMSGPLQYPKPGTPCKAHPDPIWTIHINCNGNCINIINININKMSCKESDPCDTSLELTTSSGEGDRIISFTEAPLELPLELSFKESQVTLEIRNLVDGFSFEGIYYFSE